MQSKNDIADKVRVIIVDDTRSIRLMIRAMLQTDPRIEVVGEACDPYEAREMIRALNPDVITLDVIMPRMDGLSFLERIMRLRPMPVVMVSTRTTQKSKEAITALSLGAVDCVDLGQLRQSQDAGALARTVIMAAGSNLGNWITNGATHCAEPAASESYEWNGKVVLIGSSTGGVDALLKVLSDIPENGPPILIAQHMPASFLESFAGRLERNCRPKVQLSENGVRMRRGNVYLAIGGDTHATVSPGDPYILTHKLHDGTEMYVPSVNLLFASGVRHAKRMVAVMLTGMGSDGAQPMLAMKEAGAHTIVQDSASAVIDGMPRSARDIGAAVDVASLAKIGGCIMQSTSKSQQKATP
ncbi:MAG: chemotaxis-specific protein-glutamate methyltransferase CheB [Pseudomonadota bacterium]